MSALTVSGLHTSALPLTITADDKSKAYGAALPILTVTYTGLVNGDTAATFSKIGRASCRERAYITAVAHVAKNTKSITASGAVEPDTTNAKVTETASVYP